MDNVKTVKLNWKTVNVGDYAKLDWWNAHQDDYLVGLVNDLLVEEGIRASNYRFYIHVEYLEKDQTPIVEDDPFSVVA